MIFRVHPKLGITLAALTVAMFALPGGARADIIDSRLDPDSYGSFDCQVNTDATHGLVDVGLYGLNAPGEVFATRATCQTLHTLAPLVLNGWASLLCCACVLRRSSVGVAAA